MNLQDSSSTRIRFKPWLIIVRNLVTPLNVLVAGFGAFIVYISLGMIEENATQLSSPGGDTLNTALLMCVPIVVLCPLGLFVLASQTYVAILKLGSAAFSYVAVWPEGLEVNFWPNFHLLCPWSNIQRMDKGLYSTPSNLMLIFPGAKAMPDRYFARLFRVNRFFPFQSGVEPQLTPAGFQGFPNGHLETALRENAPQLFAIEPSKSTF
jgi:hypothetical protein